MGVIRAINPNIWGESGWIILHRLSFNIKTMTEIYNLFDSLRIILPCPKCRNNLIMHLKKCGPPHNIAEIPEFIYKLHKRINENIENKQRSCITYNQVETIYKPMGHTMNDKEWIFIEAIISVHKGYYKETREYTIALKNFLELWAKYTENIESINDTTSKQLLKFWLRKNKKKALMHFTQCDAPV